jgi:DNA uptake protein ComE-like DNA-binding protein
VFETRILADFKHLSAAQSLRNIYLRTKSRNTGERMKAFLTGIGLGAAIGLWLAPAAGSETRKKLMTRGADLAESLGSKVSAPLGDNREAQQEQAEQTASGAQARAGNNNQESTQDAVAEVLNSASKTKLRSVPGIGDATARRIIESRPFESEAEVVESKVMPEKVLKTLKDKLVETDEEVA